MEDKDLIDLLGLTKWHALEKKIIEGKYIDIDPESYPENSIVWLGGVFGAGKTTSFQRKLNGTIISLSPRIEIMKQNLPNNQNSFTYYQDDKGKPISKTDLIEAKNLMICGQSLHRCRSTKPLDGKNIMIVDEAMLYLKDSVGNHAHKPWECEEVFHRLIAKSNRVFLLGWFFRDNVYEYLHSFGKQVIFEKYHSDIAKNIKIKKYPNKDQFLEALNTEAKSQRAIVLSDMGENAIKTFGKNLEHSYECYWRDNPPPKEKTLAYNDPNEEGMTKQIEVFSPIASHGFSFRNETPNTFAYFSHTNVLDGEGMIQMLFRNRDQKTIHLYVAQPKDEKKIEDLKRIARMSAQFTPKQEEDFGTWNRLLGKLTIDTNRAEIKRKSALDNIARIEQSLPWEVILFFLSELGMQDKNMVMVAEDEARRRYKRTNITKEEILELGRFVQLAEYPTADAFAQRYTDICNDLQIKELTMRDITRWDGGSFRENEIRHKQIKTERFVKEAQMKAKGVFNHTDFALQQYHLFEYMKDRNTITNYDFRHSEFWQMALEHEKSFNRTMTVAGLKELCITTDDKQCPLRWLKRFLIKHNFFAEVYRPSKDEKSNIRKLAEKSCREDYLQWKEEQKAIEDEEERFRKLKNHRIEHYLQYLVAEGRQAELTDEMKALHLIYDEWNISIETY